MSLTIDDRNYLEIVSTLTKSSKCKKKGVGAIIVKNNNIISSGVNGTPIGYKNQCEDLIVNCVCGEDIPVENITENYDTRCPNCNCELHFDVEYLEENAKLKTKDIVLHAEENAIIKAARQGINLDGGTLYVSMAPCRHCSILLHGIGIKKVIYKDNYKNNDGLNLLTELCIVTKKLN